MTAWLSLGLASRAVRADEAPDPAAAEVPLPAARGWHARLVYESVAGIWTVGTVQCLSERATPEVFGLDDRGRCTILSSYSGKWTPFQTTEDGKWLGALATAELAASLRGAEIYVGGQGGNLLRIHRRETGGFDVRGMLHLPGEEIHALVAGDLRPERPGEELLAFTRSGDVLDLRPHAGEDRFDAVLVDRIPGRVRQVLLLPAEPGRAPSMVLASRYGEIALARLGPDGLERRAITREPMGFGRVALAPARSIGAGSGDGTAPPPRDPLVIYATRDDGLVLRFERTGERSWKREAIYAGPQGPRGIAAGRFDADPDVETVAVFGYSERVQLLSRERGGPWHVRTLFEDVDKGHWLAAAELDGRNATDELIGSGYGGRIFLLSRPPGYGLPGVPTDPEADPEPRLEGPSAPPPSPSSGAETTPREF